ncbi:hypothetical protein E0198_004246 [Clavispora lusitaniae]|nr:hypothetical protein E0198_004246 [Clavispora lusitaniae]
MRAAFLLSVVAAQLACAEPLNERADVSKQTQGVSFGSPPQPVKASFGFDTYDVRIPQFVNGTNGANITRNFTYSDTFFDVETSYTDHPKFGEQKVVVNGFELQNFTFDGWHSDYIYIGLCSAFTPWNLDSPEDFQISTIDSLRIRDTSSPGPFPCSITPVHWNSKPMKYCLAQSTTENTKDL